MKQMSKLGVAVVACAAMLPMTVLAQGGLSGSLRTANGGSMAVAQMRGRVVVLFFGGMVDPQSPEELPALGRLATKYQGKNVDVHWVSLDPASTSDAELGAFAAKNGFKGSILRDSGDVLRSAGTGKRPQLPTIVVLDANGAIAGRPLGGFDRDSDFVARLAAIIDPLVK